MTNDRLAFDRGSLRSVDQDGRMRVELSHISKAMVCPYLGSEIPGFEELGLDSNKIYQLFRDPDELAKSVPTWNLVPVLNVHVPVSAEDHKPENVVGSTGTDAVFEAPYLNNSLVVWVQDSIDGIDSGEQREISCSYYYDPDMTPGSFDGEKYDGVMRNIRGNHVALVEKGRAGPDVLVNDSILIQPEVKHMSDLESAKKILLETAKKKVAKDADIQSIIELLDKLDDSDEVVEPADDDMDDDISIDEDMDPMHASVLNHLRGKVSDEDLDAVKTMMCAPKAAADDVPEMKDEPKEVASDDDVEDDEKDKKDMKSAMDKAIKLACDATERKTIERLRKIAEAEEIVRPYVGKLTAMDSAEAVYKAALKALNIDITGVHPSAYEHILKAQPNPNSVKPVTSVAMDADYTSDIYEQFPALLRK